jgi:hypothetical protein
MKTKMLDDLSAAIEKVVKDLRGGAATPAKKRMPLDEFVSYALTQISAAAKDKPEVAKRRLSALKRSVDGVIAAVAKMVAEDTDSEKIQVEVETAFAPAGGKPMADLTTASDQSSTEISLAGLSVAGGDSSFAENLNAVGKALKKLKADMEEPPPGKPRKPAKKADRQGKDEDAGGGDAGGEGDGTNGEDSDGWPLDLNTEEFRKGDPSRDAELTWGVDPDGVASPKAR